MSIIQQKNINIADLFDNARLTKVDNYPTSNIDGKNITITKVYSDSLDSVVDQIKAIVGNANEIFIPTAVGYKDASIIDTTIISFKDGIYFAYVGVAEMDVLGFLNDQHIISITLDDDKKELSMMEACDYYFSTELTRNEVATLIKQLQELHSQMR